MDYRNFLGAMNTIMSNSIVGFSFFNYLEGESEPELGFAEITYPHWAEGSRVLVCSYGTLLEDEIMPMYVAKCKTVDDEIIIATGNVLEHLDPDFTKVYKTRRAAKLAFKKRYSGTYMGYIEKTKRGYRLNILKI